MKWCWRRKWTLLGSLLVLGFVAFNFLAHQQVHGLTHFAGPDDPVTPSIETLTFTDKVQVLAAGVSIPKPLNSRTPSDFGLEYETVTFSGFNEETLEAWYIPAPGDTTFLLFHGYCASKQDMLSAARKFHDWGYSTLLVDFYGSGGSTGSSTGIGYPEAEDVAASFAWATAQIPPENRAKLLLYGRSMGGAAVARACAELEVQPSAVVLESVFPKFRETVSKRFHLLNLPAFPAADVLLFWGGLEIGANPWKHNPADYAEAIHCPTLILAGNRDNRIPSKSVEQMVSQFAGPAQLHFYDAGHVAFQRSHPERWEAHVRDFLKSL